MSVNRILFWIGRTVFLCTALYLSAALTALISQDVSSAIVMASLGVAIGVFGLLFVMLSSGTNAPEKKAEAIVFVILFWVFVPVFLALPFKFLVPDLGFLEAYFESVSAITTTGATRLEPDDLPVVILFWRSLLQWFGGVSVATFAIVILAAVNLTGSGVHRSFLFTLKEGELFGQLIAIGRLVAGVYILISFVGFVLMTLAGAPAFDAICLSLSGVSTGGLSPQTGPLQHYITPGAAFILAIICVLGSMNIALIWDVLRHRRLKHIASIFTSAEHRAIFVIIACLVLVAVVFTDIQHIYHIILDSMFFASSAGFQYQVISVDMVPPAMLITIALVGGSALSTAGGVKLIRMLLLFRHLSTDLSRLSHPSRVVPVKFRAQTIPDSEFLSIWMYFFAYALTFGIGISLMGAFGLSIEDAITTAAASLANFGPLLGFTVPESTLTYADFTSGQMVTFIGLMILGRLEVLAVLAVLMPNFWRQ